MKIALASGKGGTGKTFLTTNLFRTMELMGLDAVLADCDAEVPNASIFIRRKEIAQWTTRQLSPQPQPDLCTKCGKCAAACHFNAITCIPQMGYMKMLQDICHGCGVCMDVCPQGAMQPAYRTVGTVTGYGDNGKPQLYEARAREGLRSPVPVIKDALRIAEKSGSRYLLLDAPPGCSCPFVNTVIDADLVVLVSEPTPFGLSDLRHTVKVLRQLHKPFCAVINRSNLGNGDMQRWLEAEHIEILAQIPYSEGVAHSYSQGELVCEKDPEMLQLFKNLILQTIKYETGSHQR